MWKKIIYNMIVDTDLKDIYIYIYIILESFWFLVVNLSVLSTKTFGIDPCFVLL